MLELAKVRIETIDGAQTKLLINGVDFGNATAFSLSQKAGERPILTVELNPESVSVDMEAVVTMAGSDGDA